MKKLRNIIVILFFVILIIIVSILLLESRQYNENNIEIVEGDVGVTLEITNEIEDVDNISTFKTVEQCIQKYYNMINNESSDFYERNEDGEYIKISDIKINQMRFNLLSKEFINNNNINLSNIYEYINTVKEQGTVIALEMKQIINTNLNTYLAQGILINFNYEILDEFYIIVNLDNINGTFSIEPILNEYEDINDIKVININEAIDGNDNNKYSKKVYNYENMANNYFLTYKRLALSKPEILYNYMDTEYKNARFGSEVYFVKYIAENKGEIEGLKFTEYLVNTRQDITQFVCKDQYDNLYIFDEILPMQFSLKLDNYTVVTDKFKETYKEADNEDKVKMNVDKFIQMINRHDYNASYNCISKGFKNNYFTNQEQFENYIKNTFFTYSKFEFKNIENKGNRLYVVTVQLTDIIDENAEARKINIIMQLNDDLDFEISFGV